MEKSRPASLSDTERTSLLIDKDSKNTEKYNLVAKGAFEAYLMEKNLNFDTDEDWPPSGLHVVTQFLASSDLK